MTNEEKILSALKDGASVSVTRPGGQLSWRGKVVAVVDEPSFLLETPGGKLIMLPQRFRVELTGSEAKSE